MRASIESSHHNQLHPNHAAITLRANNYSNIDRESLRVLRSAFLYCRPAGVRNELQFLNFVILDVKLIPEIKKTLKTGQVWVGIVHEEVGDVTQCIKTGKRSCLLYAVLPLIICFILVLHCGVDPRDWRGVDRYLRQARAHSSKSAKSLLSLFKQAGRKRLLWTPRD